MHCSAGTEYVVIHEAVRPFVTKKMILDNVMMVSQHEAVNTCAPSFDAIVESADGKQIDRIPPRSRCLRGQTPQSFKYDLIVQAHRKAIENGVSDSPDDCRLVLEMEHPVYIVPGDEQNIKITTELDLFVAERLIR
jgi:2-C-methyl-D-erythritol 4-phosphate cytidylyltransferase